MSPFGASKAGLTQAQTDAIPDSGVSRWTLDNSNTSGGTAIDSWGSNDGTITGATTGIGGANQTYTTNEAYSFDGTDDDVTVSNSTDVTSDSEFTYAYWVYPDNIASSFHSHFHYGDGGQNFASMGYRNGVLGGYVRDGGNAQRAYATSVSTTGQWYHVVVVHDASTTTVYIDGSQDTSASGGSDISFLGARDISFCLFLGKDRHAQADLDDVRLYDKALTSTEVSDLYNNGSIV